MEEKFTLEIIGGVEGDCIALNNYRLAGPKPWGGGAVKKSWKVSREDILRAMGPLNPATPLPTKEEKE